MKIDLCEIRQIKNFFLYLAHLLLCPVNVANMSDTEDLFEQQVFEEIQQILDAADIPKANQTTFVNHSRENYKVHNANVDFSSYGFLTLDTINFVMQALTQTQTSASRKNWMTPFAVTLTINGSLQINRNEYFDVRNLQYITDDTVVCIPCLVNDHFITFLCANNTISIHDSLNRYEESGRRVWGSLQSQLTGVYQPLQRYENNILPQIAFYYKQKINSCGIHTMMVLMLHPKYQSESKITRAVIDKLHALPKQTTHTIDEEEQLYRVIAAFCYLMMR